MSSSLLVAVLICYVSVDGIKAQTEGELRLIDGFNSSGGRLEIYLRGEWGTVCHDRFDITDANVACRQLGFVSALSTDTATYLGYTSGSSFSPIWLDEVECSPNSLLLVSCNHTGIGVHNCYHYEDVGVLCDPTRNEGDLRLVNSSSTRGGAGRLEIFLNGEWGTVCDNGFNTTEGDVVCRQLGYNTTSNVGNVISLGYTSANNSSRLWLDNVDCTGSETNLLSCHHDGNGTTNCSHTNDVAVECDPRVGDLRLINHYSDQRINGGRLEIFLNGKWGTVCDDRFDYSEADVACRQLLGMSSHSGDRFYSDEEYGNVETFGYPEATSSTPIWLDDVSCPYDANTLLSCSHNGIGIHDCTHKEDVAIRCYSAERSTYYNDNFEVIFEVSVGAGSSVLVLCLVTPWVVLCVVCVVCRSRVKKKRRLLPSNQGETGTRDNLNLLHYKVQSSSDKQLPSSLIIPSCNIELGKSLGQGEFGVVYKGYLKKSVVNQTFNDTVAVKTVKGFVMEELVENLLKECGRMLSFDHPNVLKLVGVCLDGGPAPYIIMPFMTNGSLNAYLKDNRESLFLDSESTKPIDATAVEKKLLDMCLQIAKGMEYLASKRIIHRDLAARNCMMDINLTIKVADFGLAESLDSTKEYFRQDMDNAIKLPIKWMAPESIHDSVFSEKSDVWSYGVTCWEVFSAGRTPYPSIHPVDLPKQLDKGLRLEKPLNAACTDEIYTVILACWESEAKARPCFSDLVSNLASYLAIRAEYLDLMWQRVLCDSQTLLCIQRKPLYIATNSKQLC